MGSLDQLFDLLPSHVLQVVERASTIPAIAGAAKRRAAECPGFVRADIGQVVGVRPEQELLYGPPVGLESLRGALAELWTRSYGLAGVDGLADGLSAANVTITTGAAEGLGLLFRCFGHQKVVGLPRGHWGNYVNGVIMAQGTPLLVDFFDRHGDLALSGLSRQLEEHSVSLLLMNFPCNPTGAVLTAADMARLAQMARDTGVMLLSDEVYNRLRFDGLPPVSMLAHAPERTVVVSSASKEYLLPGARVGFVISTRSDLTDKVLRKMIRANTASPNVLGQKRVLAMVGDELEALRAGREPALLGTIRRALQRRLEALLAVLAEHGMTPVGRAGHAPGGTIFLMTTLPTWWEGSDSSFTSHVIDSGYFSVIPGTSFGLPGSVRFSYGSMTVDDIARLGEHLATLRAAASSAG